MRRVFLKELPRIKGTDKIDWKRSLLYNISFEYDDILGDFVILNYEKEKQRVYVRYAQNEYWISTDNVIHCRFATLTGLRNSDFKFYINQRFKDNNRDIIITDRLYIKDKNGRERKYYKYKCNKCGFDCGEHYDKGEYKEFLAIEENNLSKGTGCACCANRFSVPHINSIVANKETHWMIPYFQGGYDEAKKYMAQSNKKLYFKCPNCGEIKKHRISISNIYKTKTLSCHCNDHFSYPSKYIMSTLKQLNINFKTEVKYDWNKYINPKNGKLTQASIDFVIYYKDREIPLEVDGEWHRKDNNLSGQTKEASEYIDKQRDENCLKYLGEETIRITDEGDIKENILNSKLNELFNLDCIDWFKCEEFALSNLVKEVCEYWNQKEEGETTTDLAKKFNMGKTTILRYLNKGTKLGWCNYDGKEELKKSAIKAGRATGKNIIVYKDNVELEVFSSVAELERNSVDIFNVKFYRVYVCKVAKGELDSYKGYTFKYA